MRRELVPRGGGHDGRQCGAHRGHRRRCDLEDRPARVERRRPDVDAFVLEQVVGHEHDRDRADHLRDLLLAADALLQCGEGQRPFVAEGEDLAVEHGAVGQPRRRGGDLGEAVRDQLLAARPEMDGVGRGARAARGCRPTSTRPASPSTRSERLDRLLERRGEEERIGPRAVVVGVLVREQGREPRRRRRPFAHQARRDRRRRQPRGLRQRADDQRLRDADAQFAGQDLEQHEALQAIEPRPPAADACLLRGRIEFAQRKDPLLDPRGRATCVRRGRDRHLIEHERRGLGAVADDRIALVEQPLVEAGGRERPRPDCGGRNQPLQPAAGQEEHRPRRIRGAARSENTGPSPRPWRWSRSSDRSRRRVRRSVSWHQSPAGSPSQAVRMTPACSPRSPR